MSRHSFSYRFLDKPLMVLCFVCVASDGPAQSILPADVVTSLRYSSRTSIAGQSIASWSVDPLMTDQQEQIIMRHLKEPCPFDWSAGTTLRDVHRDLLTLFPTVIEDRALEELGIRSDAILVPKLESNPKSQKRPPAADPFGQPSNDHADISASAASRTNVVTTTERANAETVTPWWRRSAPTKMAANRNTAEISTAARLIYLLSQQELTLSIRSGQLILTTVESAEDELPIRVYDVTPLMGPNIQPMATSTYPSVSYSDDPTIISMITHMVDPESWEYLGGVSTMELYPARGRQWMIVAAKTTTHWKIGALLDRLNR
ncbi:hypothetical protein CA13_36470 [Planctomycetes bacterium CA13]|uniref:Uncharacterized protein n=1 Tax=Novipirellula herctigrandis TaxID=2527986 RepID=A0A5C5Z552_9BACT|nr:hypothetical protein CA13_36470 [Planctomycetes bacterium CA13]